MRSYNTIKHRKNGVVQKNYYYECKNTDCENNKVLRVHDIHCKFFCTLEKITPSDAAMSIGVEAFQEAFQEFKNELSVSIKHQAGNISDIQVQIDHLVDLTSKPMNEVLLKTYQDKLDKLIMQKTLLEQKQEIP